MTVFHTQQKHIPYPDIIIDDTEVDIVSDFKLLGITVNKHLKWTTHIENIWVKSSWYNSIENCLGFLKM